MTKLFCSALILLLAATAKAEDSVWEQQEKATVESFDAKIERIDLDGLNVTYTRSTDGDEPTIHTAKICTQDKAVNGNFYTEADRALAINLRVQAFRAAKRSKESLTVAVKGPWSPCIYPLEI